MSAWTKQLKSQIEKHGKDKASWYCEWDEPDGTRRMKSCGSGPKGKKIAERKRDKIRAELLTGTYQSERRQTWTTFRKEYEDREFPRMAISSCDAVKRSLDQFEMLAKPKLVANISKRTIATFISERRKGRGRTPGSKITSATINKDLRHIRAVLNMANEWGFLPDVPKFRFEKEPHKLPKYVTTEDFAAIYEACDAASQPANLSYSVGDWWRGVITMAFMTGWRIGEILALRWSDVDLEKGTAITRHADNKGSRDEKIAMHPVVVDHIQAVRSFGDYVFPWDRPKKQLYREFARIQDAAGIDLPCPDAGSPDHGECTDACHRYGFHDERRAFATLNAEHMTREALQALMRHKSASTTDRYINHARQLNPAVANLHVPAVLKAATVG